jgi:predicted RNase H-like HicB family nuclease
MYEAIRMHVGGPIENNLPVPSSTSFAEYVVVSG